MLMPESMPESMRWIFASVLPLLHIPPALLGLFPVQTPTVPPAVCVSACTEGDSFIIAFHNPTDALCCALAAQQVSPQVPPAVQPPAPPYGTFLAAACLLSRGAPGMPA